MSFTKHLNEKLALCLFSSTQQASGQIKGTWTDLEGFENVPCRFSEVPKNRQEIHSVNYDLGKETYLFFLNPSLITTVTTDMQVRYQGKLYKILKVSGFQGAKKVHHVELYCQRTEFVNESGAPSNKTTP